MNILITNIWLSNYAGTEVYVRDLAIALHRRGIHVEVYSPQLGSVAEDIRKAGVHIVDDASDLIRTPDLIHAQHFGPAMDVMLRFPNSPAVYFLHDRTYHGDTPPRYSQVMHHVAVDYNCLERLLIDNGIEEQETSVLYNWVDTSRFALRSSFAERPRRALVFSNYARPDNYFQVVQEACERAGIELDGAGAGLGNQIQQPEQILGDYDIVFAKAKAAMEAMATGAFVVACDYRGLGGAVTAEHFDYFRKYNFGMKTLAKPHDADLIVEEMQKYDATTAKAVAHRIREEASFDTYLDKILPLYHRVIKKHQEEGFRDTGSDKSTLKDYLTWKQQQFKQRIEKKDEQLAERDQRLRAKDQELAMKNKLLDENNHQLTESNQQIALKDQEEAENERLLAEKEQQLSVMNQNLVGNSEEIRRQVARNRDLTTSLSYRLGRLITWPLRWIYDRVIKS
jgi:hypothetical protein